MQIRVRKTWVRVGNIYCLFMEAQDHIFTKKFKVLHYNEDVVKLNKILKEHDLIDTIRQTFKIEKIDDIEVYNYKE